MPIVRPRRPLTLAVVMVLTLAAWSAAAPTTDAVAAERTEAASDPDRLREARLRLDPQPRSGMTFADALCTPDPAGDTFYEDTDADGNTVDVEIDEPRADIRRFCGDYGQGLTVRLQTTQPTNPRTADGWRQGAAALWFLDTGSGAYDHVVVLGDDDGGELAGDVFQLTDEGQRLRCRATPAFAGGELVVEGIPADCIGAPPRLDMAVVMIYPSGDEVAMDLSDTFAAIGRSGQPTARDADRLAGSGRVATAVAVSQAAFPDPAAATSAYLARADAFPDALAAGTLTDGPVLLVPSCGAPPGDVVEELRRLVPDEVVALGGTSALCDELLTDAAAAVGAQTARLAKAGADANRFGTAVAVSERAFPDGAADVYLATGEQFPDALAAGALTDGPILLVPSCGDLPAVVAAEVERTGADRVLALGGPRAVCDQLLEEAAGGRESERLAGVSRFATAAAVARFQFFDGAQTVYLARSDAFPDALAAGSLTDGPILLVPSCGDLPPVVADAVRALDPDELVALGGQGAVCQAMLRHAANA
ncbi:hypothetical protein BH20ACT8_BH20ACT8_12940 [soil metagenome]